MTARTLVISFGSHSLKFKNVNDSSYMYPSSMRRVEIHRGDFGLCHQDINPTDYEFFHNHSGAFKRMWKEQVRKRRGVVRLKICLPVDTEILGYICGQF